MSVHTVSPEVGQRLSLTVALLMQSSEDDSRHGFRMCGKEYSGGSALEIVNAIKRDSNGEDKRITSRQFLLASLMEMRDRSRSNDEGISERLDDETLALSYLYLRDEYGEGELLDVPNRNRWARPLNLA